MFTAQEMHTTEVGNGTLVAGAWTERKKMYHGGSFLKLADDNMDIQNPEAQNRVFSGFCIFGGIFVLKSGLRFLFRALEVSIQKVRKSHFFS